MKTKTILLLLMLRSVTYAQTNQYFASDQDRSNFVAAVHEATKETNEDKQREVNIFLAALAAGAALSVSILIYRKVKEGLDAASSD